MPQIEACNYSHVAAMAGKRALHVHHIPSSVCAPGLGLLPAESEELGGCNNDIFTIDTQTIGLLSIYYLLARGLSARGALALASSADHGVFFSLR